MALTSYTPQVDIDAVPGLRRTLAITSSSVRRTTQAVSGVVSVVGRLGATMDDIAELRRSAQVIADTMSQLGDSAAGIDRNAGKIADQISGLSVAAQGIETNADKLADGLDGLVAVLPTLQRLTEIVDPLENTVVRLGRFVDRLPGGRRGRTPS